MNHEIGEYAVRGGPALVATGTQLFGLPLQDWVYIVTILYTVMQIGLFVYTRIRNYRAIKASIIRAGINGS